MKFYEFRQNNSFGRFDSEEGVLAPFTIIEAKNAEEANSIAESIGIYFEGVRNGRDCSCCGDRWYEVDEDDGHKVPSLYGAPIEEQEESSFDKYLHSPGREKYVIHYKEKK